MIQIEHVGDVLRGAIGVAAGQVVEPAALARALDLNLAHTHERPGLFGREVRYDDRAPLHVQRYQQARGACAYALCCMGLIRDVSPHDLAAELCSAPRGGALAEVANIGNARGRRRSGWQRY